MKGINSLAAALVAAVLVFPAFAAAAPTVNWDQTSAAAPSAAGEALQSGFKALSQSLSAAQKDPVIYGIPQHPQDAFAGLPACSDVDAQFLRAFSLDEAVAQLAPCMQALSQRYAVPVTAEMGAVGVDGGRGLASGVLIHVPGSIMPGNQILMDLSYAIREKRHGRLFGFPAGVVSGTYNVKLQGADAR